MSRLELLDWRRRVTRLYAEVRATDDPAQAHAHWIQTRTELIRTHPQSPVTGANRATVRLEHLPYDPAFRFETDVAPAEASTLEVPTRSDGVVVQERVGTIAIDGLGTLDVWWIAGYGGGLFLPVADAHPDTYGGGRYVLDTIKGADLGGHDRRLVVDLNFAYNPSCAYDPAWVCPLAPPGNRLASAIPAGELAPRR